MSVHWLSDVGETIGHCKSYYVGVASARRHATRLDAIKVSVLFSALSTILRVSPKEEN